MYDIEARDALEAGWAADEQTDAQLAKGHRLAELDRIARRQAELEAEKAAFRKVAQCRACGGWTTRGDCTCNGDDR